MVSPSPEEQRTPPDDPSTSLEHLFRLWGLDRQLRRYYSRSLGIEHLYPWQARSLGLPGVAAGARDLLYFAPTSGGKTMVAELLLLLRVMGLPVAISREGEEDGGRGTAASSSAATAAAAVESEMATALQQKAPNATSRRAIIVLPFVSMVTEKAKHLQSVLSPYNRGRPKKQRIQVRALHGVKGGGDLKRAQIAVCTIEKANGLINRMAAADELHELSCLVVDELHMIGEGGRGQTLELLLTKVLRANRAAAERAPAPQASSTFGVETHKPVEVRQRTQIVGMSATLSNGAELANWLGAALHVSDYRPIPLDERVLLGMHVHDSVGNVVRSFATPAHPHTDPDHVVTLCRESCRERDQVIVFCPTKQFCHNCALKVAKNLKLPASKAAESKRAALMSQLSKETSMGVDPILQAGGETIPHGVAFHHAGLADTERSAIEQAFRAGTLSVLAATSTLGAGVNLPAGRVILRNINAVGGGLNATSYRQMAGRAGRKGAGRARGEALIVAANKGQAKRAAGLMNAGLAAVKSALKPTADGGAGFTKMVLEAVCGKLVRTRADLPTLLDSTLVYQQQDDEAGREKLRDYAWAALQLLVDEGCVELVRPPPPLSDKRVTAAAATPTSTVTTTTTATTATATATATATNAPGGGGNPLGGVAAALAHGQTLLPVPPPPPAKRQKGCVSRQQGAQTPPVTVGNAAAAAAAATAVSCGGRGRGIEQSGKVIGGGGGVGGESSEEDGRVLMPTKLGMAIFRSSMPPGDGLTVYRDLSGAKNGINLRHTLYLAYLLTPLCPPSGLKPNWERLRAMYASAQAAAAETPAGANAHLVEDFRKVGITENHLHLWASRGPIGGAKETPLLSAAAVREAASARRGVGGGGSGGGSGGSGGSGGGYTTKSPAGMSAARKAVRLVAAMALQDVSDGCHLGQVARSYGMNKGELQNLRQSTATFAGMVASFLKELGWTMFLMLVKGYIPKLSLGVSNQLLPLMQVPGMSRAEASALFQEGIVNAKSLLSAPSGRVATALRINVPFRTAVDRPKGGGERREPGVSECFRFDRRAQMLKDSARAVDARREKSNKAQAMKLLKAVQGRLGGGGGGALGGALAGLGGGNGLVCVAPKGRKRKRSSGGSGHRDASGVGSGHGGGGSNLGETGLSDDAIDNDNDSDSDSNGDGDGSSLSDDDEDDDRSDADDIDVAVAAFLSAVEQADDDGDDSDGGGGSGGGGGDDGDVPGSGEKRRREGGDGISYHDGGGGGGERGYVEMEGKDEEEIWLPVVSLAHRHQQQHPPASPRLELRDSAAGASRLTQQQRPRGFVAPSGTQRARGNAGQVKQAATAGAAVKLSGLSGGGGCGCGGGSSGSSGGRSDGRAGIACDQSPAEVAAAMFMTPRDGSKGSSKSGSAENDRTMRTPVRRLTPESGSSSFLYEAGTSSCPAVLEPCGSRDSVACAFDEGRGGRRGEGGGGCTSSSDPAVAAAAAADADAAVAADAAGHEDLRVGPAFAACRRASLRSCSANLAGGRDAAGGHGERGENRNIFAEGPAAVAEFSSAWRRSNCFSFVIGSREVHWLGDGHRSGSSGRSGGVGAGGRGGGGGGGGGDRQAWEYRRSWEALVAPWALPVAPYTVPSGGDGGVPLSQSGSGRSTRVVSGIAVSFDGKTSRYLPLPPLLPSRLASWHQPAVACAGHSASPANRTAGRSCGGGLGGREEEIGAGRVPASCWEALPGRALESVSLFVGFPWLCADCSSSRQQDERCRRHSLESGGGSSCGSGSGSGSCSDRRGKRRRKLRPWNQALLVCHRWNALGVKALNWLTAEEPSGRWGLLRDVMENKDTTKVCLDMKGALVCLRSLGVGVKGPLEDPAVARWLAEPPIEDITPMQQQQQQQQKQALKKRKAPPPPPRVPPASLSLGRPPVDVVDLWCLQAEATLSFMAEKEQALGDLSLAIPFFLLEAWFDLMPAVAAAALMEYSGLALNVGSIVGARRDLELRLDDLEGLAGQLAGDFEETDEKTALASPKRVHDMLYATLGVKPPPSWMSGRGGGGRGASKRASLGPTDTNSLQELLRVSAIAAASSAVTAAGGAKAGDNRGGAGAGAEAGAGTGAGAGAGAVAGASASAGEAEALLTEVRHDLVGRKRLFPFGQTKQSDEARSFIRAVVQHRYLAPAKRSLAGLLATKRRHPFLDGVRVNPRINPFTTTGRMVTSDPPLQNLDHKIRVTRSWRTSLAEETEAEVSGLEMIPRVWAGAKAAVAPAEGGGQGPTTPLLLFDQEVDEEIREALRVSLAPRGDAASMSTGEIVGIVEDRCLDDPIYKHPSPDHAAGSGATARPPEDSALTDLTAPSMVSLWRESGHSYSNWEAKSTRQVLVRLGGRHGKVYSYPADKVYRVQANFFSDSRAEAMVEGGLGTRCPWFAREAVLKPRDGLVASPGYTFVSADYSQMEMRLMAHLSGDPGLMRVFADGGDVFRRIAAALRGRGRKAVDVTEEERRQTKVVVYGVLYGQSADALVPQLGLSRPEAFKIRQTVLKTYPKLTEFLKKVKEDCKKCGYVETLLGRRRYLPQINSTDKTERSRAERQAANTTTQGSAADLLKLAATNVAARLERCEWMSRPGSALLGASAVAAAAAGASVSVPAARAAADATPPAATPCCRFPRDGGRADLARRPACRLVLSIHDELLYEVLEPHAVDVARIVKACMEGACSLSVPLVAHPRLGAKWGSMAPVEDDVKI
ncbi:unnamed protein product [Pylaiella littoralis]